jgi:hypothetical protein
MPGGASGRGSRFVGVLLATALLAAMATATAQAAGPKPVGGVRALAVSVPPDPVPIKPGSRAKTLVRVVNPNAAPVTVTIASRALSLGDDGKVSVGDGPDPRWDKSVKFPTGQLTIGAQSFLDVPLTIQVPARLSPDLYFIGFLVTPIPTTAGSLQVINRIGSFITVDVPGPRVRKLAASFHLGGLSFSTRAHGTLRIANTGRAAVRFWGEEDTNSSPGGSAEQERFDPSYLPTGRHRFRDVSGKPAWPVGMVTITVHLVYPGRTEVATKELIVTKRVLVINPIVPIALAILLLLGTYVLWWRRRGRRLTAGQTPALSSPTP